MFELEFVRDNDPLSRLTSFFEKTLLGPKVMEPGAALLICPKFDRSPALEVVFTRPEPPVTAQPSGQIPPRDPHHTEIHHATFP